MLFSEVCNSVTCMSAVTQDMNWQWCRWCLRYIDLVVDCGWLEICEVEAIHFIVKISRAMWKWSFLMSETEIELSLSVWSILDELKWNHTWPTVAQYNLASQTRYYLLWGINKGFLAVKLASLRREDFCISMSFYGSYCSSIRQYSPQCRVVPACQFRSQFRNNMCFLWHFFLPGACSSFLGTNVQMGHFDSQHCWFSEATGKDFVPSATG